MQTGTIITGFVSAEQLQNVIDKLGEDWLDLLDQDEERPKFENVALHFNAGRDFAIADNYTSSGGGLYWSADFSPEMAPDGWVVMDACDFIEEHAEWGEWGCPECGKTHDDPETILETTCGDCGVMVLLSDVDDYNQRTATLTG